jgi:hypothetical protein
MKQHVREFVRSCQICQQAKSERIKYPDLLLPLHVPSQARQVVSLDFICGLPQSRRWNCILVVVDKILKYANFLPLAHPFTFLSVAKIYLSDVYKLHVKSLMKGALIHDGIVFYL